VTIDSLAFGGDGVGRHDGQVVFVPGVAPGDEVEARVVQEKKGYVRAEVARILRPSALRVAPPCPLFLGSDEGCGGCQWQHVASEAQAQAKREIVVSALRRVLSASAVAPLEASPTPYGWRRRARLRWRRGAGLTLGYAARRSHHLVDVATCPQLDPRLDAALGRVREVMGSVLDGSGELELIAGRSGVHVVLSGRAVHALAPQAEALLRAGIAGVVLCEPEGLRVVGQEQVDLGDEETPFWARADVFAQASEAGNEALRRLVREGAGELEGLRVLELFAGSGNFTRDLAPGAEHVVAVEDAGLALRLGERNVAARGLATKVTWRAESAEVAVAAPCERPFDVVVLDPPRTGLADGLPRDLVRLSPRRIVYVSCDPATLARDLEALVRDGDYRVVQATPVDLMPQTYHVEVVAVLERIGAGSG
jgi:23S rRNA (uracil1939-C5)-methyltransferase